MSTTVNNDVRLIIDETGGEGPSINIADLDSSFLAFLIDELYYDETDGWTNDFTPDAVQTDPRLAESGDAYISISTSTPIATLDSVQLTDSSGALFDGDASGLSTTTGGAINLFSADGGSAVIGVDSSDSSTAFIVYLVPTGTDVDGNPTFGLQMVQFEAIDSDTTTSDDEPMFLTALNVSAAESTIIDFGQAPSQNVLWIAFGADNQDLQIIANGRNPDYNKVTKGDTTNTSQGGILEATLGSNSQGLTFPDALYFTYVTGYNDPADNYSPIAGDYVNANDFKDESLLTFNDTFDTNSASVVISQVVSSAEAGMKLTAMYTDSVTPEEQAAFFDGLGLGTSADPEDAANTPGTEDTQVAITDVRVVDFFNPEVEYVSQSGVGSSMGGGVTITINGDGTADIVGFQAGMQIIFETNGTDHNRILMEATSGKWDPGGFGFANTETSEVALNIEMQDDGPDVEVAANGSANFTLVQANLDETIGSTDNENEDLDPAEDADDDSADDEVGLVGAEIGKKSTLAGSVAQLFSTTKEDYGADGELADADGPERTDTLGFVDFGDPIETTMRATATGTLATADATERTLYLVHVSSTLIEVRTDGGSGALVLSITLNNPTSLSAATLTYRQFLAVENQTGVGTNAATDLHDAVDWLYTTDADDKLELGLSTTIYDGDSDSDNDTAAVTLIDDDTSVLSVDDDGPNLTIGVDGEVELSTISANLDETIGTTDNENENLPETADGDSDDDEPATGGAIGEKTTGAGAVANFFTTPVATYGTDGMRLASDGGPRTDTLAFVDFGDPIETTMRATATGTLATADATERTLYLVHVSSTLIEVRTDGGSGELVLSITLDNPTSLSTASLTYRQFLAVENQTGDGTNAATDLHDAVDVLYTTDSAEKLELQLTSIIYDGDGDSDTETTSFTLIDDDESVLSVDDDGPNLSTTHNSGLLLLHDETPGVQSVAPDDDISSTSEIVALFAGVTNKGADGDVTTKDAGAIGFAGPETFVTVNDAGTDAGTDGERSTEFRWVLNSTASGLSTTEGTPIVLSIEGTDGELLVGRAGAAGPAVFAVSLDKDTGESYLVQWLSILHTDNPTNHDENEFIDPGVVSIKVTLTDNDGDTDVDSYDVGDQIGFGDDGPSVTASASGEDITHEMDETVALPAGDGDDTYNADESEGESPPTASPNGDLDDVAGSPFGRLNTDLAGLALLFNTPVVNFGSDGAGDLDTDGIDDGLSLVLSAEGLVTNLTDTVTGDPISLWTASPGVIEGRVGGEGGAVAIKIILDGSGLTSEQYRAIQHSDTDLYDENIEMALVSGSLLLRYDVTVEDGDDDTDSDFATYTLADTSGSYLSFDDDGPQVTVNTSGNNITHEMDETIGTDRYNASDTPDGNGATDDVASPPPIGSLETSIGTLNGLFSVTGVDFGQDGAGDLDGDGRLDTLSLVLSTDGVATNLTATDTGGLPADRTIYLYESATPGVIEGRVGSATGPIAIAIILSTSGLKTEQYLAIEHSNTSLYDENLVMTLATGESLGLKLDVSVEDGDDDTADGTATYVLVNDTSGFLSFDDDGPILGSIADGGTPVPIPFEVANDVATDTFTWDPGTDEGAIAFTDWAVADATNTTGDQSFPTEWTAVFGNITASPTPLNGTTVITFSGDDPDYGGNIFRITLTDNDNGTASYDLDVLKDAPIRLSELDLAGFPSGNPVETITLGTATGSIYVQFDGILWDPLPGGTSLQDFVSGLSDNYENRPDIPDTNNVTRQDNLNRDTNGFGVFQDGSSLMNEFEGMITRFTDVTGTTTESEQGIQFVLNQNGGTDDVIVAVYVVDTQGTTTGAEYHEILIDPLTKGGQAATDPFTIVTSELEFAMDWDGDEVVEGEGEEAGLIVLDTLEEFDTVYYLYTFPDGGSNDGVRIKEVNVIEQQFLPDIRLDLEVQGVDNDGDTTQTEEFSLFFDANGNDAFDFV